MGDYVDRGPDSRHVIEFLMALQNADSSLVCLKGNHEEMMVDTIRKPLDPDWWVANGGDATLISYGHPRRGNYQPDVVPADHLTWLDTLPLMHIDEHRVFVHAGVDPNYPLGEQRSAVLLWSRYPDGTDVGHGERHVVHGHHKFADGPKCYVNRTDLDTFAWHTGRLVIGVFDDGRGGGPVEFIEVMAPPANLREPGSRLIELTSKAKK
jgi:serine/threonine protein phosphatase 1